MKTEKSYKNNSYHFAIFCGIESESQEDLKDCFESIKMYKNFQKEQESYLTDSSEESEE